MAYRKGAKRWYCTVTRAEAERAIKQFLSDNKINANVNVDTILKIMEELNLSFKVEGLENTYLFPVHLPVKQLSDMWVKEDTKKVYVGRRLFCCKDTSIFSPGTFGFFQCKACVNLDRQARLWRNGMIMARAETVERHVQCLVVMRDNLRAVDIVCRGGYGREADCISILESTLSVWVDVVLDHSPGTEYELGYLSRKHLTEHKAEVAMYSEKAINEVLQKGSTAAVRYVTDDYELVESLAELMVVLPRPPQAEHHSRVIQVVLEHGSAHWYEIGVALGFNDSEIEGLSYNKPTPSGKLLAILNQATARDGEDKVKEVLLNACKKVKIYGAVTDELKEHVQQVD